MLDKDLLAAGLVAVISDLAKMETSIRNEATRMGVDPYSLRLPDGQFVLAPILVAQASALSALVTLGVGS